MLKGYTLTGTWFLDSSPVLPFLNASHLWENKILHKPEGPFMIFFYACTSSARARAHCTVTNCKSSARRWSVRCWKRVLTPVAAAAAACGTEKQQQQQQHARRQQSAALISAHARFHCFPWRVGPHTRSLARSSRDPRNATDSIIAFQVIENEDSVSPLSSLHRARAVNVI